MKDMTIEQFNELIDFIKKNHSFQNVEGRMIKYVGCTYDTRTNLIHHIQLDTKSFTTTNENRRKNLKEWVYRYLDNKEFEEIGKFEKDNKWKSMKEVEKAAFSVYDIFFLFCVKEEAAKLCVELNELWFDEVKYLDNWHLVAKYHSANGRKFSVTWALKQRQALHSELTTNK